MREDNASGTGLVGGSVPKGKKQLKFRTPGCSASWEELLDSGLSARSVLVAMVEGIVRIVNSLMLWDVGEKSELKLP